MFKKIVNIATTILLVLLVLIVILVFISRVNGQSPSIFGFHIFRVSSDSMVPALEVREVILVKEVPVEEIHVGDIITYNGTQGELNGKTITHRVVKEPVLTNGEYHLTTKGDKEGAVADPEITYDQVEGKYVTSLPIIDKLYTFFLSPGGLICFVAIIVILFGYEMISLIMSYRAIDEKDDDYYEPKPKKPSRKRKKK